MKQLLKRLHHYFYQASVAFFFILCYPVLFYCSRNPVKFKGMNRLRWLVARLSSHASGIFYSFDFEEEIDWSKPYIICPNHTSNLDISTVISLVKNDFVFLGKDELLDNFVTGLYFKTIDIPLNRDSKISSYRAFKRADEYLKKGISVAIFPEGLIADQYPPELQSFKNGPFRLAIERQIPILPVTIFTNWQLMWDDGSRFGSKPGISHTFVHKPVETTQFKPENAEELKNTVYALMAEKLAEHKQYQQPGIRKLKVRNKSVTATMVHPKTRV